MELNEIRARLGGHKAESLLPPHSYRASVLIPLLERGGALHVLFEVREQGILQSGEICFPGGHLEPGETLAEAALRETREELLLRPEQVELLAPLHILGGHGSREIHSFLGVLRDYGGTRDPGEVASTFTVPLDWLLANPPEVYGGRLVIEPGEDFPYELIPGGRDYPWGEIRRQFYFYRRPEGVIWGLTAELLTEFLKLLGEK